MQKKGASRLQSGPMLCCVPADTAHFLVTWRWRGSFPGQEPFSVKSMGECLLRSGGCEEEMRVEDRGSSAEEVSYTAGSTQSCLLL